MRPQNFSKYHNRTSNGNDSCVLQAEMRLIGQVNVIVIRVIVLCTDTPISHSLIILKIINYFLINVPPKMNRDITVKCFLHWLS